MRMGGEERQTEELLDNRHTIRLWSRVVGFDSKGRDFSPIFFSR